MRAGSHLERVMEKGLFAVTGQLIPPKGNDAGGVKKKAELLRGYVDAVNVTDNQRAMVRMSSMAASSLLIGMGLEPVMQMVTRDRNRIALQSDILGSTALGVKNLLLLTGDHPCLGNQVDSKNVHDLDSVQLIDCARRMREEGKILGGEGFAGEVGILIGAVVNPFGDPFEFRVVRLAKKIDAGADFVQTQPVFDMNRFKEWMGMVRDRGLHERVHIMAGVVPLKSAAMAEFLRSGVPGITVPDNVIGRMAKASEPAEEGIRICVEQIEELKEMEGIHGVHIMTVDWEEKAGQIAEMAGLLPRPVLW
ncbi:MAG: methylenetetrahydrofolate reductase [Deltaproteobacteria bacterium]|nr:methylenetetrahydrofolate reductase [Deltaproteobacteria bacterium]